MDASTGLDYVRGKISATEYWSAVFPLSAFDDLCCGHPEWAAHLRSVVDSGFWRLHALDRADSFWRNTNRLATVGKLHEFAAYESQKEQDNVDAAWLSIAMSLFGGADHLEPAPWKILLRAAAVDARFLMCTAFSTSAYWTDQNVYRVATLIRELDADATIDRARFRFLEKHPALTYEDEIAALRDGKRMEPVDGEKSTTSAEWHNWLQAIREVLAEQSALAKRHR